MPTLPPEFVPTIIEFASLFSNRVFHHVQLMLLAALLVPGQRTVTSLLRIMGLSTETNYHKYHRVLSRATWSPLQAAHVLLLRLIPVFVSQGPLVFGLDDTIERRRGKAIKAKGIYRDAVRSSKSHFVKASGLRWLSAMLLVPISWADRVWALPVLTALAPSQRYNQEQGRPHKTLLDWARHRLVTAGIIQVRRWLPAAEDQRYQALVFVGDGAFSSLDFLAAVAEHVTFITRLRLDAALYEPAPERKPGQVGRPRKKGPRLPTLKQVLADAQTPWTTLRVSTWYGHQEKELECTTGTGLWYHKGQPVVPLRWVLIRDPEGKLDPMALLSTDQALSVEDIITFFVRRWSVEVTFEEARAHLGMETQRQWSDLAIARTTPMILGLFSIVTLLAHVLKEQNELYVREATWYRKPWPTFSDALASVRSKIWHPRYFDLSGAETDVAKIPRPMWVSLVQTLAYAA
jgi:hypothetical protein